SMLEVGRTRLLNEGYAAPLEYVQANAEKLPFPEDTFDCVSIAFGLRNVTNKDAALAEMCRVLKPGGRLLVLEFSKPQNPLLAKMYDAYSFKALPMMGKLVAQDSESYKYLAESIRMHPDQDTMLGMLETAGLSLCKYYNLSDGIVALHTGIKA